MQTRRWFLTHNQTKGSYPFSQQGTTDRIGRILNKHNIRTIFKSPEKIGQILRNPKNQTPPLNSAEVYKILCSCGQRDIHWRNRENDQPTKKRIPIWCQVKTHHAISIINIETGHQILFDKMITIANITSYFPRKYREAIEIQKHPNNLNRDNGYNINKNMENYFPGYY